MPIIQKKVRTAAKTHSCDWCSALIKKGDQYLYMYGYAEQGDKPSMLKYCDSCGIEETEGER